MKFRKLSLFPQNRGFDTIIGPAFMLNLDQVACVQCGQCVAVCPVGAIVEKTYIPKSGKHLTILKTCRRSDSTCNQGCIG